MEPAIITLICVTIIVLIVVGTFLVKLLIDLSALAKNLDETVTITRNELIPTIKKLSHIIDLVSNIVEATEKQYTNVKHVVTGSLDSILKLLTRTKGVFGGLVSGLLAGMKLFRK